MTAPVGNKNYIFDNIPIGTRENKNIPLFLKDNQMKTILTISEVAKLLHLSKSTVYKYSENGKIPSFKIGTSLRFLENEIDDYIQKTIFDQRNQSDNENFWKF